MEPQPTAEAEQKLDQDQKPDLKTGDDGNHHPTDSAKGNATDEAGAVTGSEEISARSVDHLHPPERTGSARKSVHWSPELVTGRSSGNDNGSINGTVLGDGSNPYITSSPAPASPSFSIKETMWSVKDTLGRWGRKVGEATKKAEDLAGNTWQHLKTGPSFADAALGRIAQGTKILAEGGYENVFRQTFETAPEEQLQNAFACYLSTSAGPVMGILYVSTEKLGFCSDNPLSYKSDNGQVEWSYYKVVIPLHQIKAINPSTSRTNPTEKYVQVISVDNLEFWFMGFLNYGGAVQYLKDASQACGIQTA